MKSKVVLPIAILCLLLSILLCIKHINEKPDEEVIREATQEEVIVEEHNHEEIEQDEPIEEEQVPVIEPEVEFTAQEQARFDLVKKYGEDVVDAWEKLSRNEFFDYIGYELRIEENYGLENGETWYYCYKVMEDGSLKDAYVGGNYYVYGIFISNEALFDLVEYHNEFFVIK